MDSERGRPFLAWLERCICVALSASCQAPVVPGSDARPPAWPATPALEWNALFARTRGWTGGDGIFSLALDGRDALASAGSGSRTVFWFSDSMIGTVDGRGRHAAGSKMINNCMAILQGNLPAAQNIRFFWHCDEDDTPRSVFHPRTDASRSDEWYWLGDGFVQNDELVVFGMRMTRRGTGGVFDFVQRGHALIRAKVKANGGIEEQAQLDLPLWSPAKDGRTELALGSGVLLHDARSGASNPDGFLYVYGTWNRGFDKELVAARVRPENVGVLRTWRFWNGTRWSTELDDLAAICGRVSSELSVTPLPDGRYVLVFLEGGMGDWVSVRLGASPVGPFGPTHRIWRCPEVASHRRVFAYNAKAHPHLSAEGELLISYNVNTMDFQGEFLQNASIYRPRFVRLPLAWLADRDW